MRVRPVIVTNEDERHITNIIRIFYWILRERGAIITNTAVVIVKDAGPSLTIPRKLYHYQPSICSTGKWDMDMRKCVVQLSPYHLN